MKKYLISAVPFLLPVIFSSNASAATPYSVTTETGDFGYNAGNNSYWGYKFTAERDVDVNAVTVHFKYTFENTVVVWIYTDNGQSWSNESGITPLGGAMFGNTGTVPAGVNTEAIIPWQESEPGSIHLTENTTYRMYVQPSSSVSGEPTLLCGAPSQSITFYIKWGTAWYDGHSFLGGSDNCRFDQGKIPVIYLWDRITPFTLAFPLQNLTPYTAEVWSAMDHANEERFGCHDGVIITYTGELGLQEFDRSKGGVDTYYPEKDREKNGFACEDQSSLYDYKNGFGTAFTVNGNYRTTRKDEEDRNYISYDGHPGYDYPIAGGVKKAPSVPILAAADGTVIRETVEKKIPGKKPLGEIWIDHENGLCTMYNHLSEAFVDTENNKNVTKGQEIGMSGSTGANFHHLHFSVFICPETNPLRYVDPYGWNPLEGAEVTDDPHTETSVCLWEVCQ